jgi:prepilin-type N-terminal cleavage/methylation domain-containing protein
MIKSIPRAANGFTLVELLVASLAAGLVTVAASSAVTYHMRASSSMEAVERTKQDWGRVSHFIEAEVALSERVITNSSNINLNQCNQTIQSGEFLFALEIRRDLPTALYYIANNQVGSDQWSGTRSLFRCGPGIDELGEYTDAITGSNQVVNDAQRLIDGMR